MLSKLKPMGMNEYKRDACLPQTRLDVVEFILERIADGSNDGQRVLWLYGLAGSGKSTISTTIARMMHELRCLDTFFFFDHSIPERNAATLITTMAYQLANFNTRIGAKLSQIVEDNSNITEMPFDIQFANLLSVNALQSVEWSGGLIVLVIDALDECGSETERKKLLQALTKGFRDLPPFIRVILTSRQESDIQHALMSHPAVYPYHLSIDSAASRDDISKFLWHCLNEIRTTNEYAHLGSNWPGDDKINALAKRAAGLFVWASTACLYIDSRTPDRCLHEVITQHSVDAPPQLFASLDELYKVVLTICPAHGPTLSSALIVVTSSVQSYAQGSPYPVL